VHERQRLIRWHAGNLGQVGEVLLDCAPRAHGMPCVRGVV
jgi:hypothetical protein